MRTRGEMDMGTGVEAVKKTVNRDMTAHVKAKLRIDTGAGIDAEMGVNTTTGVDMHMERGIQMKMRLTTGMGVHMETETETPGSQRDAIALEGRPRGRPSRVKAVALQARFRQ